MKAGRIADGGHLDARLGAIDEAVEHLRIDRVAILDLHVLVEDVPDRVGRRLVVGRVVARALAGRHHLEARRARPVDMVGDQRRLVTPGERIHHAGRFRLAGQDRAGDGVGFDIDHDDVLAVLDRFQREADAGAGIARCLDDDLDSGMGDERIGIVGDVRRAVLECVLDRGGRILLLRPAGELQLRAGARGVEVGDADDVHAVGVAGLREEHRSELSGPDDRDRDRPSGRFPFQEHMMQVHVVTPSAFGRSMDRASLIHRGSGERKSDCRTAPLAAGRNWPGGRGRLPISRYRGRLFPIVSSFV